VNAVDVADASEAHDAFNNSVTLGFETRWHP
jgi:hypothetical protein